MGWMLEPRGRHWCQLQLVYAARHATPLKPMVDGCSAAVFGGDQLTTTMDRCAGASFPPPHELSLLLLHFSPLGPCTFNFFVE
jgi:hypothetical protein